MDEAFMKRTWVEILDVMLPAQPDLQQILCGKK